MKKIIALVCFMATNALAAPLTFTAMDMVSLIIHGVRFSFSDIVPKEIVVNASGTGKTKEEAVNNALVAAVQKGLGVLVVTDDTVANGKVVRNLAAQYSSGVVNSYDVIRCNSLGTIQCEIQAKVSPWKFQRQLLANSNAVKVNGDDLHAQHMTMQYALVQRVKLTQYYFSQLQHSGLEVKVKSIKMMPTMSDTATLLLDYEVRMNPEFKKNFISFLEKLEKDTNGRTEENYRTYIQWGPTGLYENRVFINAYNANFRSMMNSYLSAPISVGIKELGVCERFDAPGGNVMTVDWYGFSKQRTINVPANALKRLNNITLTVGCNET
jgi:hypothetical protein